MTINDAIKKAEELLPGVPAPEDEQDPRWQVIVEVGKFIKTHPDRVWEFSLRWGSHECEDIRSAVATCLLEHLLEVHFDLVFPRVVKAAKRNGYFADTFIRCSKFGQSELPCNSKRMDGLENRLRSMR